MWFGKVAAPVVFMEKRQLLVLVALVLWGGVSSLYVLVSLVLAVLDGSRYTQLRSNEARAIYVGPISWFLQGLESMTQPADHILFLLPAEHSTHRAHYDLYPRKLYTYHSPQELKDQLQAVGNGRSAYPQAMYLAVYWPRGQRSSVFEQESWCQQQVSGPPIGYVLKLLREHRTPWDCGVLYKLTRL